MAEDVGSTKLKIFTFKSVLPGTYKWVAWVRKSNDNNGLDYYRNTTSFLTLVVTAWQTYNITINEVDFKHN